MLGRLKDYLLTLGVPGVLLIAFLDSALVPLPGGPDAVVMLVAWQRPSAGVLTVLAATFGSTLGCLVLYQIARKGGEVALARFPRVKRERVEAWLARNDFGAVLLSVLAPPPFPMKALILSAGLIGMKRGRFALAVFLGRGVRFGLEAYVGIRFGDQAATVLKAQYPRMALALVGVVAVWMVIRRVRS